MLKFIDYPNVRLPDYKKGHILGDIESHVEKLPNQYQDKSLVTSSHESTHYLNSTLRNQNKGNAGFYLLNGRAALLSNISSPTLSEISKTIPSDLRGISFSLYLITAQRDWQNYPLYLFDEFSAYINGSECGLEMREECGSEILQSVEFSLYCAVLAEITKDKGIVELRQFQHQRVMQLVKKLPSSQVTRYLTKWLDDSVYKKYLEETPNGYGTFTFL